MRYNQPADHVVFQLRAALALLVHLVMVALQVFRECLEREESLGLQGPKATE